MGDGVIAPITAEDHRVTTATAVDQVVASSAFDQVSTLKANDLVIEAGANDVINVVGACEELIVTIYGEGCTRLGGHAAVVFQVVGDPDFAVLTERQVIEAT